MMAKTAVKFLRGHGRFNKGEIAGFEGEALRKLLAGSNPVAGRYDPEADLGNAPHSVGEGGEIEAMRADLARKEAELDAREAAIKKRESATVQSGVTEPSDAGVAKTKPAAGNPPKRGAAKTSNS